MSEEEFFNRLINKIDKEFGYDVANTLQLMFMTKEKEIDRLNNIIKELSKDVDMWNKKYNEQFNIINELEKYIHNELVLDFYNDDMPCELIINKMEKMIKELKENK